jgi:regulator of protease activity HflC (stomatin/prohibitin superfamily)
VSNGFIVLLVAIVFAVAVLPRSIFVLREGERLAVFRLGRFSHVAGPGLIFSVPIIDRCARINLEEVVPGWRALSPAELEDRIRKIAGS